MDLKSCHSHLSDSPCGCQDLAAPRSTRVDLMNMVRMTRVHAFAHGGLASDPQCREQSLSTSRGWERSSATAIEVKKPVKLQLYATGIQPACHFCLISRQFRGNTVAICPVATSWTNLRPGAPRNSSTVDAFDRPRFSGRRGEV